MFAHMKFRNKIILCLCIAMCIAFGLYSYGLSTEAQKMAVRDAKTQAKLAAGKYGNQVKLAIDKARSASKSLVQVIKGLQKDIDTIDRDSFDWILKEVLMADESFYGIQAAFAPNGFDNKDSQLAGKRDWWGKDGRYGPYFWRENGAIKAQDLTQFKPEETREWYRKPRDTHSTVVTEPYYSSVIDGITATVAVPLFKNQEFLGVVGIDFTMEEFSRMVASIKPMGTGRAAIISNSGFVVAHPNNELVSKNITEAFAEVDQKRVRDAVKQGKELQFTEISPLDGKEYMYVFEPIVISGTDTPWAFLVVTPMETILSEANAFLQLSLIFAAIAIVLISIVIAAVVTLLTKQFGILTGAVKTIANGDYDSLADDSSFNSEFLVLHLALKDMVQKLVMNMRMAEEKTQEAEAKTREAAVALEEAQEARAQAETAKRDGMLHAASQLEGIVVQISSASDEIAAQVDEASHGADEQRERTAEAATAMQQMNATVIEVAQNASNAAESADEARQNAEAGGEIVENVVASIQEVNDEAHRLEAGLEQLGEQAEGIGNVMNVISDIADQTNLLALNAAIEAARAGEAGRGFAVVADEVRKLAEKTMQATTEVEKAVSAIQTGTRENIVSMQGTVKIVEKSTELAANAGGALGSIVHIVEATSDQVRTIATASEEQSAASEQISQNTEEVNRIASETAESMSQSSIAMTELARLSGELNNVIEQLKETS